MKTTANRIKAGFMLIELVIASFVIGAALLGILAMLNPGLKQAAASDDETRVSLFANDVMSTLRLLNDRAADDESNPNAWYEFWQNLSTGGDGNHSITQFTGFATASWSEKYGEDPDPILTDGVDHAITNYWRPLQQGYDSDGIRDYVIRYRIAVTNLDESIWYDDSNVQPEYYKVIVYAWSDAIRSANDKFILSSHFTNRGRLK